MESKEDFNNFKAVLSKEISDNAVKINKLFELRERDSHGLEGQVKRVGAKELSSLKTASTGIASLTPGEMQEKKSFLEARRRAQAAVQGRAQEINQIGRCVPVPSPGTTQVTKERNDRR